MNKLQIFKNEQFGEIRTIIKCFKSKYGRSSKNY